jgi:2-polyprenyl-3-methyl-5-hydroxy-6-metoxy-1,4-benzoquinol methylase
MALYAYGMYKNLNTKGIPATKLNYLEKIQELYQGRQFFIDLKNSQTREDYYHQSVDPDGFHRDALREESTWKENNRETIQFVREVILATNPSTILDFGCGPGWLLSSLETIAEKYGVDNSSLASSSAEQFAITVAAEVSDLSVDYFDLIIANHVLEHLKNPIEVLGGLIDKLSPSGSLVIGMPDFSSAMAHRFGPKYRMLNEPTHISLFTLDSTLLLLRNLGMEVTRVAFPFFDSPYFTKKIIGQIWSSESQSPPFFGNFFIVESRRAH